MSRTIMAVALALVLGGAIANGGTFTEVGDAGQLPASAQWPVGVGSLNTIFGTLGVNDADMYRIILTGGGTFSASTVNLGTSIDTQLFLFDSAGIGVYANDDSVGLQSTLPSGHALTPAAGGVYYLVITRFDLDPASLGVQIFPDTPFTGVHAPNLYTAIDGYVGFYSTPGAYQIDLTGAMFSAIPDRLVTAGGLWADRARLAGAQAALAAGRPGSLLYQFSLPPT